MSCSTRSGQRTVKLAFALNTPLSRQQLRTRAESEFTRVRGQMYEVARTLYAEKYPWAEFPDEPDEAYRQVIIRAGLEVAYQDLPLRDGSCTESPNDRSSILAIPLKSNEAL